MFDQAVRVIIERYKMIINGDGDYDDGRVCLPEKCPPNVEIDQRSI